MKTAKKLFSLLLVAVLLFSALPFQASAATTFVVKFVADGATVGTVEVDSTGALQGPVPHAPAKEGYTWVGYVVRGELMTVTPIQNRTFYATEFDNPNGDLRTLVVTAQYENNHPTCDISVLVEDHLADCKGEGYKLYKCTGCDKTEKRDVVPATAHSWGDAVNVPATDTTAGSTTRTCTVCGVVDTDVLDQLGTTVQFVDIEGGRATQTKSWKKGASISTADIPTLTDLNGRKFIGWYTVNNGGGFRFDGGIWNPGNDNYATTYYARYQDSIYANYASVTVYANVYNGSRQVALVPLSNAIPFTVGEYILDDLMDRREYFINTFFSNYPQYPATDYEVADQAFYMNTTDAKITDGTTLAKGNTSVYIKIKAKGSAAAPVQLFVHNKVESGYVAHYDVPGFIAGETITLTYIKNFLQSKTGKTYNITAMHDQHDWDRMLAGFTCESNTVLEVGSNGLRIHIVAPTYTSSSSTTSKPASNPATGDNSMLEITAATMLLAAAAVVTLTQLRKRKMI